MSTTQPIRTLDHVNRMKNYYYEEHINIRNYTLITFGLNTALRISDILSLKWDEVYDFEHQQFRIHLTIFEHKTGKNSQILLNPPLLHALSLFYHEIRPSADTCIFTGNAGKTKPLSRCQAYRIIKKAASYVGIDGTIGCHSLRKTFGYHAWKKGIPPALLMNIYNHSSYNITKRYLGIEQDDRDDVFRNVLL